MRPLLLCFVVMMAWSSSAIAQVRFAVLEFTNAAADPAYDALGRGLQSMLTTDLSAVEEVTLVERARLNTLMGELTLAESGKVDPKTAAKLGRLAGASHLLDGSFVVLEGKMRLDARLVEVQSGRVVLAEAFSGPREDFWDLQKQLVDKLVMSLRIELSSKERFALQRPHTADFDAFTDYASGLALLDDGQYDASLRALEEAVKADSGFALAKTTLDETRALVGQLRARADAIDTLAAERARRDALGAAREGAEIIERLQRIASTSGASDERRRLTALYVLACIHDGRDHYDLSKVEDHFAVARAHDQYVQRYTAEAVARWPAVPIVVRCGSFMKDAPRPEAFEADFGFLVDLLWEGAYDVPRLSWPQTRKGYLGRWLRELVALDAVTIALHLDKSESIAFVGQVPAWLETLGAPLDPKGRADAMWLFQYGRRLARAGDLDTSTAHLERLARKTDDASRLRTLSQEIAANAERQALLERAPHDEAREYVRLAIMNGLTPSVIRRTLDGFRTPDAPEGLRALARRREIEEVSNWTSQPILIDDHPVWVLHDQASLVTGPRSDAWRGDELRYYLHDEGTPPHGLETMLVIDGVPRSAFTMTVALDTEVPDDFSPLQRSVGRNDLTETRPTLDLLIGLRDVAVSSVEDPVTRTRSQPRPLVTHAVRIHADRDSVSLVRRKGVPDARGRKLEGFDETVVATAKARSRSAREVRVTVNGTSVTVRMGAETVRLRAPDLQPGFYGLALRGPGFLRVVDLAIDRRVP